MQHGMGLRREKDGSVFESARATRRVGVFVAGVVDRKMAPRTRAQCKRAREEEDEKRCRLCLEGEADGPLVQPCACRGSAKFIHRRCTTIVSA